jgi:hypothetical protein
MENFEPGPAVAGVIVPAPQVLRLDRIVLVPLPPAVGRAIEREVGGEERSGRGQRSTSVWLTLDHGTSSRRIPRSEAFVLDVGQHQSNAVVGSQVKMSPAH